MVPEVEQIYEIDYKGFSCNLHDESLVDILEAYKLYGCLQTS